MFLRSPNYGCRVYPPLMLALDYLYRLFPAAPYVSRLPTWATTQQTNTLLSQAALVA